MAPTRVTPYLGGTGRNNEGKINVHPTLNRVSIGADATPTANLRVWGNTFSDKNETSSLLVVNNARIGSNVFITNNSQQYPSTDLQILKDSSAVGANITTSASNIARLDLGAGNNYFSIILNSLNAPFVQIVHSTTMGNVFVDIDTLTFRNRGGNQRGVWNNTGFGIGTTPQTGNVLQVQGNVFIDGNVTVTGSTTLSNIIAVTDVANAYSANVYFLTKFSSDIIPANGFSFSGSNVAVFSFGTLQQYWSAARTNINLPIYQYNSNILFDASSNLSNARFNSGSGANYQTYLAGDMTWKTTPVAGPWSEGSSIISTNNNYSTVIIGANTYLGSNGYLGLGKSPQFPVDIYFNKDILYFNIYNSNTHPSAYGQINMTSNGGTNNWTLRADPTFIQESGGSLTKTKYGDFDSHIFRTQAQAQLVKIGVTGIKFGSGTATSNLDITGNAYISTNLRADGDLLAANYAFSGNAFSAPNLLFSNALIGNNFYGYYIQLGTANVLIGGDPNGTIEIGGINQSPYIDFHSGPGAVSYDARIIATTGNSVNGGGNVQVIANNFVITSNLLRKGSNTLFDSSDNIPISRFNSGIGIDGTKYWADDGTWKTVTASVPGNGTFDNLTANYAVFSANVSIGAPSSAAKSNLHVAGNASIGANLIVVGTLLQGANVLFDTSSNLSNSRIASGSGANQESILYGDMVWRTVPWTVLGSVLYASNTTANVVIGSTVDPTVKFAISNSAPTLTVGIYNSNTASGASSVFQQQANSTQYVNRIVTTTTLQEVGTAAITSAYRDFDTQYFRKTDGTELSRLTATGLGIGVTPVAKLHVSGNVAISANTAIAGNLTVGSATTSPEQSFDITGGMKINQVVETIQTITGATGNVTHDCSQGAIWYHTAMKANFAANFTNVSVVGNRVQTYQIWMQPGSNAYFANTVNINNTVQNLWWAGNTVPSASNGRVALQTFMISNVNSTYNVFSILQTF